MKYRLLLIFFIICSCTQNFTKSELKKPFTSKGFAYIYSETDFSNKIIRKRMDENLLQIAHNKLRMGSLIKIINIRTNDSVVLRNTKKIDYPEFYKILITKPVADKLNLNKEIPLVEVIELKKNKSFIAKKTKIFKEEEKIHNNAPVETVKIDNISKNTNKRINVQDKFFIVIAEFYSKKSALLLKQRITKELPNFNSRKMYIKTKKTNKITLLSGPYNSINLMKNDYIHLKNFGFEELDININE
tara:strand:+ start:65 stop:799 length:735 start_codon:yes stop_codon:yes gene_type:complete